MHEHNDCEHKLEYCKICDIVYCKKCKKEWRHRYIYTQPSTWIYDGNNVTISYSGDHSHDNI